MEKEKLTGSKRDALIHQINKDKSLLTLRLANTQYERLTLVTQVVQHSHSASFLIDRPKDFNRALRGKKTVRLIFEFLSAGHIPYVMRTEIERLSEDEIWVKFPDFIEKIQRRKHFRIPAPIGTKFVFSRNGQMVEAPVINIGLGGNLVAIRKTRLKETASDLDMPILNGRLFFDDPDLGVEIPVKKALITRFENRGPEGKDHCALQFVGLGEGERHRLNQWIYQSQRAFLKDRWERKEGMEGKKK